MLSDKVYNQKRKGRRTIQYQVEKGTKNGIKMQNYINYLKGKKLKQTNDLKAALTNKRTTINSTWAETS